MPRYTNLNPKHRRPSGRELWRWALFDKVLGRRKIAPAGKPAARAAPNLELVHARDEALRVTWIGHASVLVSLAGSHVLIDPVFSARVGPRYRRLVAPGLTPEQLPPIDAVLISHSHYDHLDARSVTAFDRNSAVVAPAGLGRWFRRRGFSNVLEMSWWEAIELGRLTITFVPARHWTQRSPWDYNRSWWGGFVVAGERQAVYHGGDSAWFEGFAEIGKRFPNLDAALLPIGGYEPLWFMERNHMTPEQALDAFIQLGARTMIPMHWGTFQLTDEPLREPLERLLAKWDRASAEDHRQLVSLAIGETVVVT